MSFGVGVGDIISVSTLAWRIFKSCKEASEEFKNVAGEVVSLHVVLKETEDLVTDSNLTNHQASQLQHLADGCQTVLQDLEGLLKKYQSLGTKSQRTWDRMRWGSEGIANVRTRLISNTTMLSAYNTTMVNSSMARIERQLHQFMEEVRSGKREDSVISSGTKGLDQEDEDGGWLELRKELEDMGVSPDVFGQHKSFIVNWFRQALAEDQEGDKDEFLGQMELSDTENENGLIHQRPRSPPQDSLVATSITLDSTPEEAQGSIAKDLPLVGEMLLGVAEEADLASMNYLLRHGVDVNANYREIGNMTALNTAAMYGHIDIVQRLLRDPNINVNIKNHLGHTPLSLASWFGHPEVVQLLLDHPTTMINPTDKEDGQTPLSLATEQGNTSIVKQLLAKGANPNSQDKHGQTPLVWAAKKGRSEETKLLLAANFVMPNKSDDQGLTPLAHAVESKNDIIVRLLLADPKVIIDAAGRHSITPLDRAWRKGYLDMIPLFEQAKARRTRTKSSV